MTRWSARAGRVLGSFRHTDQLAVHDGRVLCPVRGEPLDVERCGQCPWVVTVSVDPGGASRVTCRRARMSSPFVSAATEVAP